MDINYNNELEGDSKRQIYTVKPNKSMCQKNHKKNLEGDEVNMGAMKVDLLKPVRSSIK